MIVAPGCTGASSPAPAVAVRADTPASASPPATPAATPVQSPVATPVKPEPEVRQIAPGDAPPALPPVEAPPVAAPTDPAPALPIAAPPDPATAVPEPPLFPTPPAVAVASIEKLTPGWEVAMELDRVVKIERLDGGLLFRLAGEAHDIGPDGTMVARPQLGPPAVVVMTGEEVPIIGAWPGDVWRIHEVTHEREGSDLSFLKWRGNNRWVAQPFMGGNTDIDENELAVHRWSPRGGFLLVSAVANNDPAQFHRVAGKYGDPDDMPLADMENIRDVFESIGGTLFLFVDPQKDGVGLQILRSCKPDEELGCEHSGGVRFGRTDSRYLRYETGVMAARQRWSISAAINEEVAHPMPRRNYIVHYEAGGWKLDAVPGDQFVTHMLPVSDGSLWIVLKSGGKETLWHRSNAGKWVAVALPGDVADMPEVEIALRDESHLWIAVNAGERHTLYSTRAALQAPPEPTGVVPAPASAPG